MDFPSTLRARRTGRRLSQLDLATLAGTTQRHLSFIESGRSTPGRAMVVRLAESLGLPLRERNELLLSAGYAPVYAECPLDGPELAPVRAALGHILEGHLPYPALVVDRNGDVVAANAALGLLTDGAAPGLVGLGTNAYRLALHPDGLAPRILNFPAWSRHVLAGIAHLPELHAELLAHVPPLDDLPGRSDQLGFAVPLHLRSPFGELHLMTTVTTFATAVDVTLAELRLEAFLPVDEATAAALRAYAERESGAESGAGPGVGPADQSPGNW
ncbi:helix-turn-helix transcriptional regulator [Kitasatospora sp. NPDC097605]|uniref:helix-turn-helix domain-containing protein n=1 Tax=Kitasatospora sp. NPDC097605 TaxID=3157226 RepID=UPI00332CC417